MLSHMFASLAKEKHKEYLREAYGIICVGHGDPTYTWTCDIADSSLI